MDGRGTSCACGFPVPRAVVTCMEPQHKVPLGHVLPTQAFLKKESSHLVYPQAGMEAKKVSFQQRNLRMGLDPPRRRPRPLSV
ncbi:unnamed protein product, partial [Pylaiella littoralis]